MAVDAVLLLSVLVSLLVYMYTKQQVPSLIPTWAELFHCFLSCIVYLRGAFWVPTSNGTLIHILTGIQTSSFHFLMNSGRSASFSSTGYLLLSVNLSSPNIAPGDPQGQPPDPEFLHCSIL